MNPLARSILTSSIWIEDYPTRVVWITLLAAMDADGFVQAATTRNLAALAGVTAEEADAAMARFEAPDPSSSNPAHEGRRVARVAGGWRVLNAGSYRAHATQASRARRPRTQPAPASAADLEAFQAFWRRYPNKAARQNALKAWQKLRPDATLQAQILAAVEAQRHTEGWQRDGGRYVPHGATYLNNRRWEDVVERPAAAVNRDAERARTVALVEARAKLLQRPQEHA